MTKIRQLWSHCLEYIGPCLTNPTFLYHLNNTILTYLALSTQVLLRDPGRRLHLPMNSSAALHIVKTASELTGPIPTSEALIRVRIFVWGNLSQRTLTCFWEEVKINVSKSKAIGQPVKT